MQKTQLHHNIKKFRKRIGMDQNQLANALGVTRSDIIAFENGKRYPDIFVFVELQKMTKLGGEELLYGIQPNFKKIN